MTKIDETGKNCKKFFHRVIFAFWIQIYNPNLCESHTFWNTANIEKLAFFRIRGPDEQNWCNRKNCPKFFHRVIFVFWIQICNPNLCKSHIFWITGNIEKWSFFAYLLRNYIFLHTRTWWPKSMKSKKLPEILS